MSRFVVSYDRMKSQVQKVNQNTDGVKDPVDLSQDNQENTLRCLVVSLHFYLRNI
jgi:hypothetical protein